MFEFLKDVNELVNLTSGDDLFAIEAVNPPVAIDLASNPDIKKEAVAFVENLVSEIITDKEASKKKYLDDIKRTTNLFTSSRIEFLIRHKLQVLNLGFNQKLDLDLFCRYLSYHLITNDELRDDDEIKSAFFNLLYLQGINIDLEKLKYFKITKRF